MGIVPRFSNGRIPSSELVTLDTGGGRHVTTYGMAIRWYLLRRNVFARTGITLYISAGMNAYRDYAEQLVGRVNACAQGNCNAAAAAGYSSHGGTWSNAQKTGGVWVDAMAFDIGNYWAIRWDIFVEECARVGLNCGWITKQIAGIEEPWHVISLDPYHRPPGYTLTQGTDGVWRLAAGSAAGDGSTPFDPEEDDVLDQNRDYEAFKNMMWRFLKFESRDGGPVADGKEGPTVFERLNAASNAAPAETGLLANTEQNYQNLVAMLQRGYHFDIRPNGVGATWELGPTVFELLQASGPAIDYEKLAGAIVAAGGTAPTAVQIAKAVNEDAAKRLQS